MKESPTYQAIVVEDRALEAQALILRAAKKRFEKPDADTRAAIEAIVSPAALERLFDWVDEVDGWPALIAELPHRPARCRGNGRPRG